jgi:large subunit ribosomal protein L21
MTIYAVMRTGGKEYRVAPGDVVRVEKLEAAPGATVEIREVCLIAAGQDVTVGSPTVADARVVAEVIEEGRGEKIVSFRKKRRNHYQMTIDDVQSYTTLRIREIAVGESVYAAGAPRRDVVPAETPPASLPRMSRPERQVPEPRAKKPLQAPTPPAPPSRVPFELPPVVTQGDAPVAPRAASEEGVGTQPEAPQPTCEAVHPVHAVEALPPVETAAPGAALDERRPRRRSHRIAALAAALLVIAAGLLVWGSHHPQAGVEAAVDVAPDAVTPKAAQSSVPQPATKTQPRRETAIRRPVAASAPSAPVQPPE